MNIDTIIFDLDGTLIDSMGLWRQVDQDFLTSRGIEVPEDLFDHIPGGNSFIQTAQYFKDRFSLRENVHQIMQEWTDLVGFHYRNTIGLKDDAESLLKAIKGSSHKLGLATSNSYELAESVLKRNGVWELFDFASTGCKITKGKPYPDIYLYCLEGLKSDAARTIAIEDTLSGVMAAKAAGIYTYGIWDGDSVRDEEKIRELADDYCLDYICLYEQMKKRVKL
ncbi:MAG: HAD family phosphatase [Candidatus Cloacimonetes bacterium]|jgi:beta-phosphoglucomutase-like phosphatase (HAD superfamily)|nr:HAD family phosphatase [Candidatus Cloacimonadota bacterium]